MICLLINLIQTAKTKENPIAGLASATGLAAQTVVAPIVSVDDFTTTKKNSKRRKKKKMNFKLIKDPMNGERFQWRFYDASVDVWFDYGEAYDTIGEAMLYKPSNDD